MDSQNAAVTRIPRRLALSVNLLVCNDFLIFGDSGFPELYSTLPLCINAACGLITVMQNQKMKLPESYNIEIVARIEELLQAEVAGNVAALYEFVWPAIREKRERERDDEPQLTKDSIAEFVSSIKTAELTSLEITEHHENSKIYGVNPAIKVQYSVSYNQRGNSSFCSIWVKQSGLWYSTSLGKLRLTINA